MGEGIIAGRADAADTAIPAPLAALEEGGVSPAAIRICLVGGARMFEMDPGSPLNLGERNVEAIREVLRQRGLWVHAEDVGCVSRTVTLHVGSGRITVRSGAGEERELSRDVGPR